jgi:putative sigma-54 modulation protein
MMMKNVEVKGLGLTLTDTLREHTLRRIATAFDRIGDRIGRITVRVGDLNGPRGGCDKYCRVLVRIPGLEDVYVEDTGEDLYETITRAVERAAWSSRRRVRSAIFRRRSAWPGMPEPAEAL